jgi:hypothetical protein
MNEIVQMLLYGIGAAGLFGGPYIVYLAFYKPATFPKPKLAKWQGAGAFLIGLVLLFIVFKLRK